MEMIKTNALEAHSLKIGNVVRNERRQRWGVVSMTSKEIQFECGTPQRFLVYCLHSRGIVEWQIEDISVVMHRAKVIWEDKTLAPRFEAELQEVWKGNQRMAERLELMLEMLP